MTISTGADASPGTIHGRAMAVGNLSEAGKVGSGDIPVCEMMMWARTPLSPIVSAAVFDTGGAISPRAIGPREDRLPGVVRDTFRGPRSTGRHVADGWWLPWG